MFYLIGRILKFALQNFWRNIWLSAATVTVLALTLVTVNVLIVVNFIGSTAIETVERKIDVSVYFKPETNETTVLGAQEYLLALSQVRDAVYITPEAGLARFRERHAGDEAIESALKEVGVNPIGPTLIVTARSPEDFSFILEALDNPSFRDAIRDKDFQDYESIIRRMNSAIARSRMFVYALSIIFMLISVLIVFNTVRVAIYTHRDEISIMRLVGASSALIRAPFVIESIFYSLLATVGTGVITFLLVRVLDPQFRAFFEGSEISVLNYYVKNSILIFGLQFGALALLNIVSASFAMRKYLKV
ncbi:MAG: putative cell division protein FtsX [uncultured bacterium]|nr:MAG: putative cell division protein FtsX [uncultured bacterium]